ncbi:MAG TPA: DUF4443 domain-containing protein [Nitrososphaera sp.]|nr:DUF4443 domain-containing protein [Nitrososphaera sp.]
MQTNLKTLNRIASRYAPSRILSFNEVHVFRALELMRENGRVSRMSLGKMLGLGEGAIKTLVKHMKMNGMVETTNGGTRMTQKGIAICEDLVASIPANTRLPKCSVALGKFNHAVLLRGLGFAIKSGIEQRDVAVKMNALGATTLLFRDGKFLMPAGQAKGSPSLEQNVKGLLIEKLKPLEGDAVIIGSANDSHRTAELAAKYAALATLLNSEKRQAA